jgi:hypothetical protein
MLNKLSGDVFSLPIECHKFIIVILNEKRVKAGLSAVSETDSFRKLCHAIDTRWVQKILWKIERSRFTDHQCGILLLILSINICVLNG